MAKRPKSFRGRIEDVGADILKEGIEYGVSIGRRAPMHYVHVMCLQEIADAGLKVIPVLGSTQDGSSQLFNPVRNPLTVAQQTEQMRLAVPKLFDDKLLIAQPDNGDDEEWLKELRENIQDITGGKKAAMHFRSKAADAKDAKALSNYAKGFLDNGLYVWESFNRTAEDDAVNATAIRRFDLNHLTQEQRDLIAAPDYIIAEARKARASNPDKALLEKNRIPLTVFDLTLDRMRREAGIGTAAVVKLAGEKINLYTLADAAGKLVEERSTRLSFSASAQKGKSSQANAIPTRSKSRAKKLG